VIGGEMATARGCSLCGSIEVRPGCLRCEMRPAPPTAAELEQQRAWSEAQRRKDIELEQLEEQRRARLRALGRPVRVALVGCGKSKQEGNHAAAELYTGQLFRASLAYAKAHADEVYILSAFYGLLELDQVIGNYDRTLAKMGKDERAAWASRARQQLAHRFDGLDVVFVGLAGREYLAAAQGWTLEQPLEGKGIGERLAFFKAAAAPAIPAAAPLPPPVVDEATGQFGFHFYAEHVAPPPPLWRRVDGDPSKSKLTAEWESRTGWTMQHCGHPTALYPWQLWDPAGNEHREQNGHTWRRLRDAFAYVAHLEAQS
jgi:hypothetical protein